jgi:hypothetical protein
LLISSENSLSQAETFWEAPNLSKASNKVEPLKTPEDFDYGAQRLSLLKAGGIRLFITAFNCIALAVTIYGFSTLDYGMTAGQRRGFNIVVVGLSITLSLILFHSLEWGARVIRWRVLRSRYYSPDEFNLLYDSESKLSNFYLLWRAKTQGSYRLNKVQWLVLFYLVLSVALLIDTALLGLTYTIEVSPQYKMTRQGAVSVANMTMISPLKNTMEAQYQQAQNFGLISQGFILLNSSLEDDGVSSLLSIEYNGTLGLFWYRFSDLSATDPRNYVMSDRYITSNATCREVKVISGGNGGATNVSAEAIAAASMVQIQDGDQPIQSLYIGELQAPGTITWLGSVDMGSGECGPRCAHVWALQSAKEDSPGNEDPRFWKCTNNVSKLLSTQNKTAELGHLDMPDNLAQVMAGAIGFSGIPTPGYPYQRVQYADGNAFVPAINTSTPDVLAATAMWFTAGAFSAMDSFSVRLNVTSGDEPIPAQVLDVEWKYTVVVLVLPPIVQAILLVAIIAYGNDTVIRDGGALATAELLRSCVEAGNAADIQFEKHESGEREGLRIRYWPSSRHSTTGTDVG